MKSTIHPLTYFPKLHKIIIMRPASLYLVVFIALSAAALPAACKSSPQTAGAETSHTQPQEGNLTETSGGTAAGGTDSETVNRERYERTLAEVRGFIDSINKIIEGKNYKEWVNSLSDKYYANISSSEFLARQSELPGLKTRRIVLRTPEDYFENVVVPSRANSQVDDITFDDNNDTVRAIHINPKDKQRLRLYVLQKIGNDWKIVD